MEANALQRPTAAARSPLGSDERIDAGAPHLSAGRRVGTGAGPAVTGSVAVMVLVDVHTTSRLWAWGRLIVGARAWRSVPGLKFAKVMGSGANGGFGLRPSGTHRGLFLLFDDEAPARSFLAQSPLLAAYRQRAREMLVAVLRASSCKGSWSGATMTPTVAAPEDEESGPIAALTRASIHASHALAFWRLSPPAEHDLARAEGCRLAVGLGEAPVLRQCTFSLWDSTAAMNRYARSGAHQQAIRAAYGGGHFSESMFVRFVPLSLQGSWQGRHHG